MEKKSETEIFRDFFELQNNQPMSLQQEDFVQQLIFRLKEKETGSRKEKA